jgi:hypothetical protein
MSVQIKGYYIRTSDDVRGCDAHPGTNFIAPDETYVRVMRLGGKVEFYHPECFKEEFGIDPAPKTAFRHG